MPGLAPGALCGAVVAIVVICAVQQLTKVHFFLYAAIGMFVCFTVGWLASWLIGPKPTHLDGLTRATRVP